MIDILLLLALPASGKSEIRRYIEHLGPQRSDLHLGPTIQLDDYPYVHAMRRISEEQRSLGHAPAFFEAHDTPFLDPRDWLTLIHLVNEDFMGLGVTDRHPPDPGRLIDRIEAARELAGATVPIAGDERSELEAAIAADAADIASSLPTPAPDDLAHSTVVIEFARGGPEGSQPPLPFPLGYEHSLSALAPAILERASILYVWVTPEESRRRNRERAIPGRAGDASILHHGVPEAVMRGDYGMDDIAHLVGTSPIPGTLAVPGADGPRLLPFARFDNRDDHTSFLRSDPTDWPRESLTVLREQLGTALDALAGHGVDSPPAE